MTRIGVFICHCGHNIASAIDIEKVVEYAKGLPGVAYAGHNLYSCSQEGLGSIKKSIEDNDLDRVVVAACTPRTHEPLFRRACEQAGINKYLFEFVNIREHCSWIHAKEPEAATEKAKKLVAMGVAKAALLEPQEEGESEVVPRTVVIGAGISGLAATASLLEQGIETHLVERGDRVGGLLKDISMVGPEGICSRDLIEALVDDIENSPKAHLHLNSRVKELKGFIGNFDVIITKGDEDLTVKAGAIIVATGAQELQPKGEYGFGEHPAVITQLELERRLGRSGLAAKKIVIVNCTGSRQPGREYCSRICCNASLKNAIRILEANPEAKITILHRDIMSCGTTAEALYREASEKGVRFVRYGLEQKPGISTHGKSIKLKVFDEALDESIDLDADLIVLATPLVSPDDSEETSKLLKVPRDKYGFFLEAHVKLRPVEFATDGVFVCGSARWPVSARESIWQGQAAAAKASIPISEGKVRIEAITAEVDSEKCAACGNCVLACPYEAIEIVDDEGRRAAKVSEAQCKGCGTCVAACHNDAIQQKGFSSRQLGAMIDALARASTEGTQ
ncbi:MAG: CoB--CoM heterodisulfide reductase iron-sulfur subunit A family protein [Methanobacteriota archaeon]|nr:MAG: CoB--CoM heterodisulfide reductase iron-sulfur subunit A family protein [Euryarchaeota archaeon]